jgi:hypothetical protein
MLKKLTSAALVAALLFSACSKKDSTSSGLPDINEANNKIVGASAREFLTGQQYTSLKIEIQYMPGYAPDQSSVNNMVGFLNNLLNKPGGIQVTQTQIAGSGKANLTINDIATIEKNNRTAFTTGTQLAAYLLITDAQYFEPSVLGLAYRNTSMALMGKTIHDNSGGVGQVSRTKLTTTVLQHELGHVLGLVNLGTPLTVNHQDAAHGNHCNNQNCLMYYTANTTDLLGVLLVGNIPQLDANCVNDLKANGGR